MPLATFQIIHANNDPIGSSFIGSTGGVTYLVNELTDIKATLRLVNLATPWVSLLGLQGSWAGNLAWTYVSGTQASIQGDQRVGSGTGYLQVGQRVEAFVTAGTVFGQISALSFGSGITTVTFVWDSGSLDAGLTDIRTGGDIRAVAPGVVTQANTPLYAVITNGGSGAAFTGALSPVPAGYVVGQEYRLKWTQASQGSDTVNLNALGAIAVLKWSGGTLIAISANDIAAGQIVDVIYDGTQFQLVSGLGATVAGIVNITESSFTATATLSSAITTMAPGDAIIVAGNSVSGYNGRWVVATVSGVTVTFLVATSGLGTGTGGNMTDLGGSSQPHGEQLFVANGIFTVPAGVYSITVKVWGSGGGSGGFGAAATDGGNGGVVTVAGAGVGATALTASGGLHSAGTASGAGFGGSGGPGSNGVLNLSGNPGFPGNFSISALGGGFGGTAPQSGGAASIGQGGAGASSGSGNGSGGGGGGGYAENVVATVPGATFAVTVPAGGTAGTGGTNNGIAGIAGAALFVW